MISYFGATLLYSTYVYTSHDWWADTDKQRARHKKQLLLCFIIILIKWNCAIFHKWNTNLMQISGWRENKQQLALLYAWFVCMCAKLNFHNQFHAYMFIICGCLMLNAQCSLLMLICLSYVIIIFFGNSFSFLSVPLIYLRSFLASVLYFFYQINFVVITSYISIWKSYLCIQQINFPVIIVKYTGKKCDTVEMYEYQAFGPRYSCFFFLSLSLCPPMLWYWSWFIKCHDKILHNIQAFGWCAPCIFWPHADSYAWGYTA